MKTAVYMDREIIRRGIEQVLSKNFETIHIVNNSPDIAIIDFDSEAGKNASEKLQNDKDVSIISFTDNSNPALIKTAMRKFGNLRGWILHSATEAELTSAISAVMDGATYFQQNAISHLFGFVHGEESRKSLTKREYEVLNHIANGLKNKAIAARMGLSVRTVEFHRANLMEKLDIRSAAGLTKYAMENGMLCAV